MCDDNSITLRSSTNKADTKTAKKAKTKGPAASSVVEVVKELFKDKEFQLILRKSVTAIVRECIENNLR